MKEAPAFSGSGGPCHGTSGCQLTGIAHSGITYARTLFDSGIRVLGNCWRGSRGSRLHCTCALLPFLTDLSTWLTCLGVPLLGRFSGWRDFSSIPEHRPLPVPRRLGPLPRRDLARFAGITSG